MDNGFPMAGATVSKIVNPDVVFSDVDKKNKANLTPFQIAVLARGEALERCLCDPDENVVLVLMDEIRQHTRSLIGKGRGIALDTYREVANTRVAVNDRKRTMELEQNTV